MSQSRQNRHKPGRIAYFAVMLAMLPGCSPSDSLQELAEHYVRLALALDYSKPGEVDAWFGPQELEPDPDAGTTLDELLAELHSLSSALAQAPDDPASGRKQQLQAKTAQLTAVVEVLASPGPPPFAEEAERLYGLTLPTLSLAVLQQQIFDELSALLPGTGSLAFRVGSFRNKLLIPAERRKALFERALEECRARTLAKWTLPATEQLKVEWTRDVTTPWHRYEGGYQSILQLNDLTLAYISSPLDVACHEGYPGHHAQFVLFEAAAGGALAVEDTVVLLRSPESAMREGAANLGVDLVFPATERLKFEQEVLFPLAGLNPELAETNLRINALLGKLALVTLPILEEYRNGDATYNATTFELDREALVSNPTELLRFVDEYGAYSVGYTLLREQLQAYTGEGPEAWDRLRAVLSSPSTVLPDTQ